MGCDIPRVLDECALWSWCWPGQRQLWPGLATPAVGTRTLTLDTGQQRAGTDIQEQLCDVDVLQCNTVLIV